MKNKKIIKRKNLLPKKCSRCGDFLMHGMSIFFLPYEQRYVCFCGACHRGLKLPENLFVRKEFSKENWENFWNEKI